MELTSTNKQSSRSSIRLLRILECMAENRVPMRLQDISKQVEMTQSTVLRYLIALQEVGYVYQEADTSRYNLTWRVCRLSENLDSLLGLRNITTPFINGLANSLLLGTCLVIDENSECLYVDYIESPNAPTLQRIGKSSPLHATGSGKILLSTYSENQFNDYLANKGLTKYTEHTITDPAILRKELERVRQEDFAVDNEECEVGLRCVSMPLRNYSGRIIAAMSIFGSSEDMSDQKIQDVIYPALKDAVTTISTRLGYLA